jgi:hypothetical protein
MTTLTGPMREAVAMLEKDGFTVSLQEEQGMGILVIANYALPDGWNRASTGLLIKLPASFPVGNPDMFWVDEPLRLVAGGVPQNGDSVETILGEPWRRLSWHPSTWNPGVDDIRTYLQFVERRLRQVR